MKTRSLLARLTATHLVVVLIAIAAFGLVIDRALTRQAERNLTAALTTEARLVQGALAAATSPSIVVASMARTSGMRITLVDSNGAVIADSEQEPDSIERLDDQPEISQALRGSVGTARRLLSPGGRPLIFVALPPINGVVVRTALPAEQFERQQDAIRNALLLSFLLLVPLALGASALLARDVAKPLGAVVREVRGVARGEFATVQPTGPREVRLLADTVNQMAAELADNVQRLSHETAFREQILSAMHEAVILMESDVVIYANPAARDLFGDAVDRVAGLVQPDGGAAGAAEITLHHPYTREVRATAVPLSDGTVLVVARDVTRTVQTERMRRDFVANVSHELKTPVAGIMATAETLGDAITEDPVAATRFAGVLRNEAIRMSMLIADLLDLARLEAPETLTTAPIDLSGTINEQIAIQGEDASAKQLTLRAAIDAGLAVVGRQEEVTALPRNLIENAIRYTPAGGTIEVSLRREGNRAVFAVRDSGAGIPRKDLPRIFERFYRVDPARARDTGGTGLGLAIVRHVAESMGGSVTVTSESGAGSTFTVTLPLRD